MADRVVDQVMVHFVIFSENGKLRRIRLSTLFDGETVCYKIDGKLITFHGNLKEFHSVYLKYFEEHIANHEDANGFVLVGDINGNDILKPEEVANWLGDENGYVHPKGFLGVESCQSYSFVSNVYYYAIKLVSFLRY